MHCMYQDPHIPHIVATKVTGDRDDVPAGEKVPHVLHVPVLDVLDEIARIVGAHFTGKLGASREGL